MNPDTILFILSEIDKEMKIADIDRQLYLMERRKINLKRLEEMEEKKWFWMMNYCKKKQIPSAQKWAWDEAKREYNLIKKVEPCTKPTKKQ